MISSPLVAPRLVGRDDECAFLMRRLDAVLAQGTTVIDNAAREPEIVDLCAMLTLMGAKVDGAGTSTITVEGVAALTPVAYTTVPDRIVAGTWAIGAVMTRGDVVIER